jgi:hypothetical protein
MKKIKANARNIIDNSGADSWILNISNSIGQLGKYRSDGSQIPAHRQGVKANINSNGRHKTIKIKTDE